MKRHFPTARLFYLLALTLSLLCTTPNVSGGGTVAAWGYYLDTTVVPLPEYLPMYVPAGLTNVVAISAGVRHAVALKANGTVVAWGDRSNWQTTVPPGLNGVVAINCGNFHTLALRTNGTVVGWGYTSFGAEVAPPNLSNVIAVAGGFSESVAVRADGTVTAWGHTIYGNAAIPPGLSNVVAVTAIPESFTELIEDECCVAVKADGAVVAWNFLGNPVQVPTDLQNIVAIDKGIALKADGTVVGYFYSNGSLSTSATTNFPGGLTNIVAIAPNAAVRSDGTLVVWGPNNFGQTNVPANITNVVSVAGAFTFRLAITGDGKPFLTPPLPMKRTFADGETVLLRASARGERPLSYQWSREGTNLPGATSPVYADDAIDFSEAGRYTVTVSNALGWAESSSLLEVVPLLITSQPRDSFTFLGATIPLYCGVAGREPLSFQWRRNGADVPGATTPWLILSNAQFSDQGVYSLWITNTNARLLSSTATVRLSQVASWGGDPLGTQNNLPLDLTNIVQIAAGAQHSVALRANGTVAAWGGNCGESNINGLRNAVAIAAGGRYAGACGESAALLRDGNVVACGDNQYGQTAPPYGLTNVIALEGGSHHFLALKADGTVAAWGAGFSDGWRSLPEDLMDVVAIAAGGSHDLALKRDGTVVAFGGNTDVPLDLTNAVAIAAGASHSLALREDGTVVAWGGNDRGQTSVPAGLNNVIAVSCGGDHSLAVRRDGKVVAWGYNHDGQTNVPPMLAGVAAVAGGGAHSVALVGNGPPFASQSLVQQVVADGTIAWLRAVATGAAPLKYQWSFNGQIIAGATNSLLLLRDIQASDAGLYSVSITNAFGAINLTNMLNVVPVLVRVQPQSQCVYKGSTVKLRVGASGRGSLRYQWHFNGEILSGETSSCLVLPHVQTTNAGSYSVSVMTATDVTNSLPASLSVSSVLVVGDNSQLQNELPPGLEHVNAVASRGSQVVALKSDRTLACWGTGTPAPPGLSNIVALSVGGDPGFALVLTSDGTLAGWGFNGSGQLTPPLGLSNVVAISSGTSHSLALRADGTVVAWGGSAGSGKITVPPGLTDVVAVAAGAFHSLALQSNGQVVGWSDDGSGPATPPSWLTNATAIAAGYWHSLALTSDGVVVAWGNNSYGQATVPTGLSDVAAIAAGGFHSIALKRDGTLVLWGQDFYGQTEIPLDVTNVVGIAGAYLNTVVLLGDGPPLSAVLVTNISITPAAFSVCVPTQSGRVYALEYKQALNDTSWTHLPLAAGNGSMVTLTDRAASATQRFYRVRRW